MEERNPQERECYPSTMAEAEGMRHPRFQLKVVEVVERIREEGEETQIELGPGGGVEVEVERIVEWGLERRQVGGRGQRRGVLLHCRLSRWPEH